MNETARKKYFVGAVQAPLSQQKSCPSVSHGVSEMGKSELGMRVLCGCFETQAGSSGLAGGVTALMALRRRTSPPKQPSSGKKLSSDLGPHSAQ